MLVEQDRVGMRIEEHTMETLKVSCDMPGTPQPGAGVNRDDNFPRKPLGVWVEG